jgi:hypothetical protein
MSTTVIMGDQHHWALGHCYVEPFPYAHVEDDGVWELYYDLHAIGLVVFDDPNGLIWITEAGSSLIGDAAAADDALADEYFEETGSGDECYAG